MTTRRTSRAGDFFDRTVRHQIELERYTSGVVRRMLALLARTDEDLVRRIRELDPNSRTAQALTQRLESVRAQVEEANEQLRATLAREAGEFAAYEASWVRTAATVTLAVEWQGVTREQVRAAAMSRPFAGIHLRFANFDEHMDELGKRRAAIVRDTIRKGFLEGRGVDDIVRELRGTRAQGYADGVLTQSQRTVEAIVRTALNHTANAAREEVYKVNASQITGVQWIAVIDARTSSICRTLDGQVFEPNKGPRPPAHPNCRSATIAILKGQPPYQKITYDEWLRQQPAEVQDEVLGKKKGRLFRDGGLKIDRFANEQGKEYTLLQLQQREAAAWEKAGLADIRGQT
jgi:SPP1 gp7 family putative phage head morphogenesis protein